MCLSSLLILLFSGCLTSKLGMDWPTPKPPVMKEVRFVSIDKVKSPIGGFYIDATSATNLADNIDELKSYNKKLVVLVREMKNYYGAK